MSVIKFCFLILIFILVVALLLGTLNLNFSFSLLVNRLNNVHYDFLTSADFWDFFNTIKIPNINSGVTFLEPVVEAINGLIDYFLNPIIGLVTFVGYGFAFIMQFVEYTFIFVFGV